MPSNKFKRDFYDYGALKRPGRIDRDLFQYMEDCGDGYGGIQWMIHKILGSLLFPRFIIEGCEYDGVNTLSLGYIMWDGDVVQVSQQTIAVGNSEWLYINENGVANTTAVEATAQAGVVIYERDGAGAGFDVRFRTVGNVLRALNITVQDLLVNQNAVITGNANIAGDVGIASDLDVDGVSHLDDTDIDGTLDVAGITDLHDELDMNDNDIGDVKAIDGGGDAVVFNDDINMNDDDIEGVKFFELNEQGAGPTAEANIGKLYLDDNNHLYLVKETGEVNLVKTFVYGFIGGGGGFGQTVRDYTHVLDIDGLVGNGHDRSNLTVARGFLAGVQGHVYGFFGGGMNVAAGFDDTIDYINMTVLTFDAIDRGNLTVGRMGLAGVSGSTYGYYGGGGNNNPEVPTSLNIIDYINMTVLVGNAVDVGDLTVARIFITGITGHTKGYFCGGYDFNTSTYYNVIDYIDLATLIQNATDVGDLTVARSELCGVQGESYGFICGGNTGATSNIIDYINLDVLIQNAVDVGDLTVATGSSAGVSGNVLGCICGGVAPSAVDTIQFIELVTISQNASDKGTLENAVSNEAGVSF